MSIPQQELKLFDEETLLYNRLRMFQKLKETTKDKIMKEVYQHEIEMCLIRLEETKHSY